MAKFDPEISSSVKECLARRMMGLRDSASSWFRRPSEGKSMEIVLRGEQIVLMSVEARASHWPTVRCRRVLSCAKAVTSVSWGSPSVMSSDGDRCDLRSEPASRKVRESRANAGWVINHKSSSATDMCSSPLAMSRKRMCGNLESGSPHRNWTKDRMLFSVRSDTPPLKRILAPSS